MVLNLTVGGFKLSIGDEWDFQSKEEAEAMKLAVSGYLQTKQGREISPEFALCLAIGAYSLPRLAHENTRKKLGGFFGSTLFKVWRFIKSPFAK
jgi:hypothetical protein